MDIDERDDDCNGNGEGVWSPDIEQCFREAMAQFPPCGRRKHILQEEGGGKMYGRNELISRYIFLQTGKHRTRKQVSSHIQVLARRKAKAEAASSAMNSPSDSSRSPASSTGGSASCGGAPAATTTTTNGLMSAAMAHLQQHQQQHQQAGPNAALQPGAIYKPAAFTDLWTDRPIVTAKIRLAEFSAFIERRCPAASVAAANPLARPPFLADEPPALVAGEPAIDLAWRQPAAYQHLSAVDQHAAGLAISNHQAPNQILTDQHHHNHHHAHMLAPDAGSSPESSHMHLAHAHPTAPASQAHQSPTMRHSYVKIDYAAPIHHPDQHHLVHHPHHLHQTMNDSTKLERIDINQIQDKFPEIGGLFARGPADAFFLVKFWADLNNDFEFNLDDQNAFFAFSSRFETIEPYKDLTCSTKACSYGLQVVEKVEKVFSAFNQSNGRYSYDISRSPMCEFMIQFIKKLRRLPRTSQMNSVLENFTVLQMVTHEATNEILLCMAYVFEVASLASGSAAAPTTGPQYNVYKLTKD